MSEAKTIVKKDIGTCSWSLEHSSPAQQDHACISGITVDMLCVACGLYQEQEKL